MDEWHNKRTENSKAYYDKAVESRSINPAIGGATMGDGLASSPKQPESAGAIQQTIGDNIMVTGNITVGGMSQKAISSGSIEQVIIKRATAGSIGIGSVTQESSNREAP